MAWTLYVRNAALGQVVQLDDYQKLDAVLRFNDVGSWTLDMAADAPGASALQVAGAGLTFVSPQGAVVFGGPATRLERDFAIDRNRLLVSGSTDTVWLARRVAHPQPTTPAPPYNAQGYDVRTGQCSAVLRQYVDFNAGGSALGSRQVPGLTLAVDPALGATVTGRARWQPLLGMLQDLALAGGALGFQIQQVGAGIQFSVYQPIDRSASVVFSTDLANLAALNWSEEAPTVDYVYVGGSGEDVARTVYEGQDSAAIAQWGRVETFADRRDTAVATELAQAATDELSQGAGPVSLAITPVDLPQMTYLTHYGLGDKVTVMIDDLPVQNLIREVHITMTPEDGVRVVPTVGTPGRTDLLGLFGDLRRAEARIRNLERR